jgi:hypothetical protein
MKVNKKLSILFSSAENGKIPALVLFPSMSALLLMKTAESFLPASSVLLPIGVARGKASLQRRLKRELQTMS